MSIRNVQKSGNAYYLYLPTDWCRHNHITNDSQLALDISSEGKLIISPHSTETKEQSLILNVPEHDFRVVNKLIVSSYLNPVKSFKIRLDSDISSFDVLDYKKLLGGIELVEFGERQISCESSVFVDDPDVLLRTMIKKIVNMIKLVATEKHMELVNRYEEEVDRSNILINKSAISTFMFRRSSKLKPIELFYIVRLSIDLERIADHLIMIKGNGKFLAQLTHVIKRLDSILENVQLSTVLPFIKDNLKINPQKDETCSRILNNMNNIGDVLMDWAVSNELERKQ